MADKNAAKARRQARNRQERATRQARTESIKKGPAQPAGKASADKAATATKAGRGRRSGRPARSGADAGVRTSARTESSPSKGGSGEKVSLGKDAPEADTPAAPGGFLGKLFPPRPEAGEGRPAARGPLPPSEVYEVATDQTGWKKTVVSTMAQPGGRPAILALMVAIVAAVALIGGPVLPQAGFEAYGQMVLEDMPAEAADRTARLAEFEDASPVITYRRLLDSAGPVATAVLSLVPLLIAGMAVRSITRPTRTRTLMWCMFGALAYVWMTSAIGIYYLVGAGALGFAWWKSRRDDMGRAAAAAAA